MSDPTLSQNTGLPLQSFSKSAPPGWRSGLPKYPYRLYIQLLKLWWRQTDITEGAAGPTIAGRYKGTAFQVELKIQRNLASYPEIQKCDIAFDSVLL